jgi:hypothetical protein
MNAEPQPRTGPIVLGLFILGQLIFLVASNLLGFLATLRDELKEAAPEDELAREVEHLAPGWLQEEGHLYETQKLIRSALRPWERATGQEQNWALFSPPIAREIVFPAVEFRWDDDQAPYPALAALAAANPWEVIAVSLAARGRGDVPAPIVFLSDNEPADPTRYFRFGQFRVRRFEGQLDVTLYPDETPEQWHERIEKRVSREGNPMRYYLGWRLREFKRRNPGRPNPTQIILLMRRYHVRAPDEAPPYWDGPFVSPVARLRPRPGTAVSAAPLESYDPETGQFEAP